MKHPITVVNVQDVLTAIESHEGEGRPAEWGWSEPSNIKRAVSALRRTYEDYIDFSRVVNCIREFETTKMIGGANKKLNQIISQLKEKRVQVGENGVI